MGKYYLEEERFKYSFPEYLGEWVKPPMNFYYKFNNEYTLIFYCDFINKNGGYSYKALVELYDSNINLINKIFVDMSEKNINSGDILYKFLRDWVQESINKYECDINQFNENCSECGFCK